MKMMYHFQALQMILVISLRLVIRNLIIKGERNNDS